MYVFTQSFLRAGCDKSKAGLNSVLLQLDWMPKQE